MTEPLSDRFARWFCNKLDIQVRHWDITGHMPLLLKLVRTRIGQYGMKRLIL